MIGPAPRDLRRQAEQIERRALRSGRWPPWTRHEGPPPGARGGWPADISHCFANGVFAVLVRPIASPIGEVLHLAIRTVTSREPSWSDLQRIKNELIGAERHSVQIYPRQSRLVDEANMYHLWIMPEGFEPGFGLHQLDEAP